MLESLDSSLSVWDLMTGRSGMRKECRRSCFLAKWEDEKLDSGICGMWSELAMGELTGGTGRRLGLRCRGR